MRLVDWLSQLLRVCHSSRVSAILLASSPTAAVAVAVTEMPRWFVASFALPGISVARIDTLGRAFVGPDP
eukprot:4488849-Amphidinium_carterae.2